MLKNCTVIEGNLQVMFMFNNVDASNYTAVVLPDLVEITGYLLMYRVNGLSSLGQIFPNLRVIRGKSVFYSLSLALYEMEDLVSISLRNLTYLGSGVLAMQNPQLCYIETVNWRTILREEQSVTRFGNRNTAGCNLVEDCSAAGSKCAHCWDMDSCQKGMY